MSLTNDTHICPLNYGVGEDSWESLGLHTKNWLIGKDSGAGRDWGQKEKGTTEDEMVGWHHWLDGCESEWSPGVGDGQGGLACCDSWGCKESDTTEWLMWSDLIWSIILEFSWFRFLWIYCVFDLWFSWFFRMLTHYYIYLLGLGVIQTQIPFFFLPSWSLSPIIIK